MVAVGMSTRRRGSVDDERPVGSRSAPPVTSKLYPDPLTSRMVPLGPGMPVRVLHLSSADALDWRLLAACALADLAEKAAARMKRPDAPRRAIDFNGNPVVSVSAGITFALMWHELS